MVDGQRDIGEYLGDSNAGAEPGRDENAVTAQLTQASVNGHGDAKGRVVHACYGLVSQIADELSKRGGNERFLGVT